MKRPGELANHLLLLSVYEASKKLVIDPDRFLAGIEVLEHVSLLGEGRRDVCPHPRSGHITPPSSDSIECRDCVFGATRALERFASLDQRIGKRLLQLGLRRVTELLDYLLVRLERPRTLPQPSGSIRS